MKTTLPPDQSASGGSTSAKYRPEVDGLRALAVIPVVFFHLYPNLLPGGYLGVDIFFVISGYLITSILISQIRQGTFKIQSFWMRRIKRLFPAASVVLTVTLLAGAAVLYSSEWQSLSRQGIASLTSWSNILFWRTTGNYWGESAESMPLLHTWSLAIEEQFYILFPLVLILVIRKADRRLPAILSAAAAVSFAGAVAGSFSFRSAAFYLLPFRMWELLLGAILASLQSGGRSPRSGRGIPFAGLLLIAAAYTLHSRQQYSTVNALAACCGTCLLLNTPTGSGRLTGRILSHPAMVYIGKISYSLYLWHWPVIVISKATGYFSPLTAFPASVVLASLTYHFIESKTRHLTTRRFLPWVAGCGIATAISISLPYWVHRDGISYDVPGFMSSINLEPVYGTGGKLDGYHGDYLTGLVLADRNSLSKLDVAVFGDSHALMYFPAIHAGCKKLGLTLAFYGADGGAAPFLAQDDDHRLFHNENWTKQQWHQYDQARIDFVRRFQPAIIVVCGRWKFWLSRLGPERYLSNLNDWPSKAPGSTVLYLEQPPELPFGSDGFTSGFLDRPVFRSAKEDEQSRAARQEANAAIAAFARTRPNCTFVSTATAFEQGDLLLFRDGKTFFYKDDDHLSIAGAMLCEDEIIAALRKHMRRPL